MNNFFTKVENIFIVFCLAWGIIFLIINPPFQASDEPSHMFKMYGFSEGILTFQKKSFSGETQAGLTLPASLAMAALQNHQMIYDFSVKTNLADTKKMFNLSLEPQKKMFCAFSVPSYTPISYFPGFIILFIMKIFKIAPLIMMYILRFCILLTYLALIYFSIKITPIKKWLFFSAATIPQAIYFASAINTDAIVTGLAYLSTAYTLYLTFDNSVQKVSTKQISILAILLTLLNICKFPYINMFLLIFIIPKEKFETNKTRFLFFTYLFLLNALIDFILVGSNLLMNQGITSINATQNIPLSKFISFVFLKPLILIKILLYYFIVRGFYYLQGIFALFGWSCVMVPPYVTLIYLTLMTSCGIINEKTEPEFKITLKHKLIFASIFILMTLLTAFVGLALFGIQSGTGIFITQARLFQGRYWIPLVPIIFLTFNCNKARFNLNAYKIFTTICFCVLLFICSIILISRYYI